MTLLDVRPTLSDTMKTLLALLLTIATASAQNITKVTTLVVKPNRLTNEFGVWTDTLPGTNSVSLLLGEAARVGMLDDSDDNDTAWAEKDGFALRIRRGDVLAGPVTFVARSSSWESPTVLTLERWKVAKK